MENNYKIKSLPEISRGSRKAEAKRIGSLAEKETEEKKESEEKESKEKMHQQMVQSNNAIVESVKDNTLVVEKVLSSMVTAESLSGIKETISAIEIPEPSDGENIVRSVESNTKSLIKGLLSISNQLSQKPETIDFTPSVKTITKAIEDSSDNLIHVFEQMQNQIEQPLIEESEKVLKWSFDFTRDANGLTTKIEATAIEIDNG